jgi:hypothetical protein
MLRGAAVIFIVALVGIIVFFATRSTSPAASTTPPPARSGSAAACASLVRGTSFADGSLNQRTREMQQWMSTHRGQQASLVVTEDVLNDVATGAARNEPVRDLHITIEPAGFRLSATATAIGSFPIKALLVPSASSGGLRITIRDLDTDGMPILFRGAVQDAIARSADPTAWGIQMRVDGVATSNGCAVVWGTA